MTHAEATHDNPAGVPRSTCPGDLEAVGSFPGQVLHGAIIRTRVVTVYRCNACDFRLSVADGRMLNAYRMPPAQAPGRDVKPAPGADL